MRSVCTALGSPMSVSQPHLHPTQQKNIKSLHQPLPMLQALESTLAFIVQHNSRTQHDPSSCQLLNKDDWFPPTLPLPTTLEGDKLALVQLFSFRVFRRACSHLYGQAL